MRRLFTFGAIFLGLLIAFGLAGEGGLQTPKQAEAVETTTTWMYNGPTGNGISVAAGAAEVYITPVPGVAAACTNCYITRIVPDLVYKNDASHADGTTANYNDNNSLDGIWMHHMVVYDPCGPGSVASGNERSVWSLPAGYGRLHTNCNWFVNYHLHNNGTATRSVAVKLVVTYRTAETLTNVTPIWWDMSNRAYPKSSEFDVPEGYSDTHTGSGGTDINGDFTSTIQATIIAMGGHVHDYGISVSAYNNRLGDYICTSVAGYGSGSRYLPTGGPGTPGHPAAGNAVTLNQAYHEPNSPPDDRYHIQEMTPCSQTPVQAVICVGDVIRLHTQYNNSSGFPILDAMGIIAGEVDTRPVPDINGNGVIDDCDDTDGDTIKNVPDNCPLWSNTSQAMPPFPVPTGDAECDGFPDTIPTTGNVLAAENHLGTDATVMGHCAATTGPSQRDNEPPPDRWPPDFDDSGIANGQDLLTYSAVFGKQQGDSGYSSRFDLSNDNKINGNDVLKFAPFFGKTCA